VAQVAGLDVRILERAEAALIEGHPTSVREVVKTAERRTAGTDAQELDLAVREPIADQRSMKPLDPAIGKRAAQTACRPPPRVQLEKPLEDAHRMGLALGDLDLEIADQAARTLELRARARGNQRLVTALDTSHGIEIHERGGLLAQEPNAKARGKRGRGS